MLKKRKLAKKMLQNLKMLKKSKLKKILKNKIIQKS